MIYFDHAAGTRPIPPVIESLATNYSQHFANSSSLHELGVREQKVLNDCRATFLTSASAEKDYNFIFVSSATEANNLVINSMQAPEKSAVCFKADHPSVVRPVGLWENTVYLSYQSDGSIDEVELLEKITPNTSLVVLTWAQGQSGVIHPIFKLSSRIKQQFSKVHIHIDGAQAFGKVPINLAKSSIDSMSISSHKMGGPIGVAGLYFKKDFNLAPLFLGGGHEFGLRASTPAVPLAIGFSQACTLMNHQIESKLKEARDFFNWAKKYLSSEIPSVITPFGNAGPYILSFIVPGIYSDVIIRHLEVEEIYLSTTSACSSRQKINTSLIGLIPNKWHKHVLRASFFPWGLPNESQEEWKTAVKKLKQILEDLSFLT